MRLKLAGWIIGCLTLLAACASPKAATTVTPTMPPRADVVAISQPQATPLPTPGQIVIRVWWPDELYPQNDGPAEEALVSQFEGFRLSYSSYKLDVRRKRSNGLGGILPTLRAARPVAPGAMPDLTLMRRSDMITAATEGLIYPIEDTATPDLLGANLLPGARALGEIDGTLYGLPYVLNIYHNAYRAAVLSKPLLTFDDVLTEQPHYLFPAGTEPLSWTVLLQYYAAGGALVDTNGTAILNREPLVAVLDYYAQGVREGIFGPALINYTRFDDYWLDFANADTALIGVDSLMYLSRKTSAQNVGFAPIPTLNGKPITMLDGWMWVLTTNDPDHQQQARAFLSWMMRISQQSAFTEAFGALPSQARALRLWEDEAYAEFSQTLIASSIIIPSTQRSNSAAIALRNALIAVLEGASANMAADAALVAVESS